MLRIVGGLKAFAVFGLWIGAREPAHLGPIQTVYPSKPKCVSERIKYVWRCTPRGSTLASGSISFTTLGQRHYLFDLPPDSVDVWGVIQTGSLVEVRVLDLEVVQ